MLYLLGPSMAAVCLDHLVHSLGVGLEGANVDETSDAWKVCKFCLLRRLG